MRSLFVNALDRLDRRLAKHGATRGWPRRVVRLLRHVFASVATPPRYSSRRDPDAASSLFSSDLRAEQPIGLSGAGFVGDLWDVLPDPPVDLPSAIAGRVATMRRAAVLDLFDQVGLELVPGIFSAYTSRIGEIDKALAAFLTDIGVHPELVRRGSRSALRRANEVIELLVDVGPAFRRLGTEATRRLEGALRSGKFKEVRAAAEIVSIYETIVRLEGRWPPDGQIPAMREFLAEVRGGLDDPLSSSLEDARDAQVIADQLAKIMARLGHQDALLQAIRTDLLSRGYIAWPNAAFITEGLATAERIIEELLATPLAPDDAAALLDHLEDAIRSIQKLRAGSGGGSSGRRRTSGGPADDILTELERALIFYGFGRHDRPAFDEIKRRWRSRVKDTHPDLGGDATAFREVTDHFDVLKRNFG